MRISTSRSKSGRAPISASMAVSIGGAVTPSASRTPATCPIGVRSLSMTSLPAGNPGAIMDFWPQPPWNCNAHRPDQLAAASAVRCCSIRATPWCCTKSVTAAQGDGCLLRALSMSARPRLVLVAERRRFERRFRCRHHRHRCPGLRASRAVASDLTLNKVTLPSTCFDIGARLGLQLSRDGAERRPGQLLGPIKITDTLGTNAPATTFGPWVVLAGRERSSPATSSRRR